MNTSNLGAELLAAVEKAASECGGCDGDGRHIVTFNDREAEYDPCEDCADIRAVIAKAEEA
jgi:Zn finger protein HypA/HybF involved in hydrogenase expression